MPILRRAKSSEQKAPLFADISGESANSDEDYKMSIHTRRGYQFEKEVHNGLDLIPQAMVFKIPDAKATRMITPVKVPADFMISLGHEIYTFEAKQTKLHRIPWSNFRQHQIDWVLHCSKAYFVINFNNRHDINRTFLLNGEILQTLINNWDKSVPISAFEEWAIELERKTAKYHPTGLGPFIEISKEVIENSAM